MNTAFRATSIWSINSYICIDVEFAPADANPEPAQASLDDEANLRGDKTLIREVPLEDEPGDNTPPRQLTYETFPSSNVVSVIADT